MKKDLKKLISFFFILVLVLNINIGFLSIKEVNALEQKQNILLEKISIDYTKKFCNSIGFGLSKESAMNFTFSENKKIFEKKKGFKEIDKKSLANQIATSVIDGCGYQLDLYGDKNIEEFANFYLSVDQENS